MKKNLFTKLLLTAALFSIISAACTREKISDPNVPSYRIAESEKLVIPAEIDLSANLPNGNSRVATYYAEGVQKYKAQVKAGSNPVTYEWMFVAPLASLYDVTNKIIGTHGAGPYWQLSANDSIFAQQFNPVKSASPDANSIPWLQLMPKTGKTPTGIFSNVAYIQRIATTGGKAPPTAPANLSDTIDVKYTAIYRFTKKNL